MATWLKVSTAVDVMMGPFLDETDGKTIEGSLSITQPDIRLSKNGGAFAQKNATQTLSHGENGWYSVNLNATDTGACGSLVVAIHEAGALPVWREFMVVPAIVYDSLIGSGTAVADLLDVSVTQWLGGTIPAVNVTGVPKVDNTHWLGGAIAVPTQTGVPEVDVTAFGGTAGGFNGGVPQVNTTHFGGITGTFATGRPEINVSHWAGTAVATPNTAGVPIVDERNLRTATATAGAAGSITLDVLAPATVDTFKGCQIEIISGTGAGQSRLITAYSSGQVATVVPNWVTNPASGSVFKITAGQVDVTAWGGTAPNALASGRVDASLGATIDGKTYDQIMQLVSAVLLGKVSGMGSNAPVFRDITDTVNRVSATTDASGNRTAVTLNNT